jgi:hypothetical protein
MDIEIGDKTFTPGTYRSKSAINIAHGTVVTLNGNFEASTLVTTADTVFIPENGAKGERLLGSQQCGHAWGWKLC